MPTTLPLERPLPHAEVTSEHLAIAMLMIWAVALLLFSAIASLGPNPVIADPFDWSWPL